MPPAMPLRCAVLLLLLVSLPVQGLLAAESRKGSQEADPQTQIISIGKLREEISRHQDKIEQAGSEEHSLLEELEGLDTKIGGQKARIEELQARLGEQERIIAAKERELAAVTRKTDSLRRHLIKRLRSFYLNGTTGFLDIVFSSGTLPDLMVANDAYHSLVTYDQELFSEYRTSVVEIDRAKRAHELEQSVQEHFLAEAAAEKEGLQRTADEKNRVLHRIRTEKGLYEQALREMKKAESTLLATLEKHSQSPENAPFGFGAQRNKLPPPVWGKVVRRFQESPPDDDDTTFAQGITILPPAQAEVFAVYGGLVLFSGYMSGYGRVVIIEHDQEYYTVTARLDDLRVQEGDVVRRGQIIGTSSEELTPFGQGAYFEIRHGTQPENPLDWIRPGALPTR
ncbi:murein hydrolase activator EnvC family protein [Desulfobulbus elongatus]|uniref:murein hydrolase activator EnvC family protein n=1 Tax=Desulfobulbus elongatus TaxID=53332 RepID=UPI000488D19D|nr:peptidoglycan DD-metalloendopeptidase family protein [Desulfobulbus elongatus]